MFITTQKIIMERIQVLREILSRVLSSGSGQALAEFAVFGTLFLFVLAALIKYGLVYNYQQKADMTAFRRALAVASSKTTDGSWRGSGSYGLQQTQYIPNPQDSFETGAVSPVSASATVTRSPYLDQSSMDAEALKSGVQDIQTSRQIGASTAPNYTRRREFSAGFRIEHDVPTDWVTGTYSRYKVVYGQAALTAKDTAGNWVAITSSDVKKGCTNSHDCNCVPDVGGGPPVCSTCCDSEPLSELRILDPCIGSTPDYDSCFMQARMLVDNDFCNTKCIKNDICTDSDCYTNCSTSCDSNHLTNPPNSDLANGTSYDPAAGGAWYAKGYSFVSVDNGPWSSPTKTYTFPELEKIFHDSTNSPTKSLGWQKGTMGEVLDATSHKVETSAGISNEKDTYWNATSNTPYLHQDVLDSSGEQILDSNNTKTDQTLAEVFMNWTRTMQTDK